MDIDNGPLPLAPREPRLPEGAPNNHRSSRIFRGHTLGAILSQTRTQLCWRPSDRVAIKSFLALHRHDKFSINNDAQLRCLAASMNVDVNGLDAREWEAIKKKIISSLKYHLDKLISSKALVKYYDSEQARERCHWPDNIRDAWIHVDWLGDYDSCINISHEPGEQPPGASTNADNQGSNGNHLHGSDRLGDSAGGRSRSPGGPGDVMSEDVEMIDICERLQQFSPASQRDAQPALLTPPATGSRPPRNPLYRGARQGPAAPPPRNGAERGPSRAEAYRASIPSRLYDEEMTGAVHPAERNTAPLYCEPLAGRRNPDHQIYFGPSPPASRAEPLRSPSVRPPPNTPPPSRGGPKSRVISFDALGATPPSPSPNPLVFPSTLGQQGQGETNHARQLSATRLAQPRPRANLAASALLYQRRMSMQSLQPSEFPASLGNSSGKHGLGPAALISPSQPRSPEALARRDYAINRPDFSFTTQFPSMPAITSQAAREQGFLSPLANLGIDISTSSRLGNMGELPDPEPVSGYAKGTSATALPGIKVSPGMGARALAIQRMARAAAAELERLHADTIDLIGESVANAETAEDGIFGPSATRSARAPWKTFGLPSARWSEIWDRTMRAEEAVVGAMRCLTNGREGRTRLLTEMVFERRTDLVGMFDGVGERSVGYGNTLRGFGVRTLLRSRAL